LSTEPTSSLRRHKWCVAICIVLLSALVTMSAFLYINTRSLYFEQNMHTYALGAVWGDLSRDWAVLADDVNNNKSALNQAILESEYNVNSATNRLGYLDSSHSQEWYSLYDVYSGGLQIMAENNYFQNNSTGWIAQVCQNILSLNTAINSIPLSGDKNVEPVTLLYNQNANTFFMNETAVQNVMQLSTQLATLINTNAGTHIIVGPT